MELTNEFRVSASPRTAWEALTDVDRVVLMLPGAKLQEIEGDDLRGILKVKVGSITAQYKGTASVQDKDEADGRIVVKASGRDTRGQGNASALITATLVGDGAGTRVTVVTELTVTGKVAQFGRGVLADVSAKLIGQFVEALEADLERGEAPGGDAAPVVADLSVPGASAFAETVAEGTEAVGAPVVAVPASELSDAPADGEADLAASGAVDGEADGVAGPAASGAVDGEELDSADGEAGPAASRAVDGEADGVAGPAAAGAVDGEERDSAAGATDGDADVAASGVAPVEDGRPPSASGGPGSADLDVAAGDAGPVAESDAAELEMAQGESAPSGPTIQRVVGHDPEPADLLDGGGASVAKRLLPIFVGVGAVVVIVAIVRTRRRQ